MTTPTKCTASLAVRFLILTLLVGGQSVATRVAQGQAKPTVSQASVRKYMEALASDEMRGRGSATADELAAAKYIASQLKLLKIEAAGDDGGYLQTAKFMRRVRGEQNTIEGTTTNVVGILRGSDPKLAKETVLLSAHLDHLGIGREVNGDKIYNGADDDASGVTAVLELAESLAAGPKPKRTVVLALFGSEEIGGLAGRFFQGDPPTPTERFVPHLPVEII